MGTLRVGTPGGKVDGVNDGIKPETFSEAFIREVFEENGIPKSDLSFAEHDQHEQPPTHVLHTYNVQDRVSVGVIPNIQEAFGTHTKGTYCR